MNIKEEISFICTEGNCARTQAQEWAQQNGYTARVDGNGVLEISETEGDKRSLYCFGVCGNAGGVGSDWCTTVQYNPTGYLFMTTEFRVG